MPHVQAGLAGQVDDSQYPGSSAVYQTPGVDPKQRWWHVLDNAFILPEYIAEVSLGQQTGASHAFNSGVMLGQKSVSVQLKKLNNYIAKVSLRQQTSASHACNSAVMLRKRQCAIEDVKQYKHSHY